MTEIFIAGFVLGVWAGFRLGYGAAVRRSGRDNLRAGIRRLIRGKW